MRFSLLIVLFSLSSLAQGQQTSSSMWQPVSARLSGDNPGLQYQVNEPALRSRLYEANLDAVTSAETTIELPMGDGELQRFKVIESPIMEDGLAARYPQIKSYRAQGVDDPSATGRLTLTDKGFHGMMSTQSGTHFIDPQDTGLYRALKREENAQRQPFSCGVTEQSTTALRKYLPRTASRTAGSFMRYRLAVAGTAEYVAAVSTGTASVSQAQAAVVVAIDRVNQIYERDLGVTLVIVANNDALLYTNASTDPYTNSDEFLMLDENQTNIDNVIGTSNYDIGHVFGTGGGGIASLGSVCASNSKAQGATGLSNPTGDSFYIDYVAHEMGHQFSAEHTFNGTSGFCSGANRVQASAFEPGSGATIMAYAGICDSENIQSFSDAHFHAGSIAEIDTFTTSGTGNSCGTLVSATNPNQPTVDAGSNYTVPAKTPFVLSASASDSDGHSLSYSWYQMDAGTATTSHTLGYDLGDNALFRSYYPRSESFRHFPALGTTLKNQFDDSEVLGCFDRDINFRVSVRDGDITTDADETTTRGGVAHDDVVISVDGDSGPFQVTAFNTSQPLSAGSYTMTWDVANTNSAPINCAQVDISLLSFNATKTTYSEIVIASAEVNDGSAPITVPANANNQRSRFKVQCSNNVFYDISDEDLTITGGASAADNDDYPVYSNDYGLVVFDEAIQACGLTVDTIPPVLILPSNITVSAQDKTGTQATQSRITNFLNSASALDNGVVVINNVVNNAPAKFLAGQTTTVTFSATDAAGNTASASASVTVREYDPDSGTGFSGGGGALPTWVIALLLLMLSGKGIRQGLLLRI